MTGKLAVVAFGGNALVRDNDHQSIPDQYTTVVATVPAIADMISQGWDVVIVHGNGPQAGYIMRRSELALSEVSPVPLDYVVADTQGGIGYMFVTALDNELKKRELNRPVAALLTRTVVRADDPAFIRPTKPVGGYFDESSARRFERDLEWSVASEGSKGWRRTVPSPDPQEVVELPTIRSLVADGTVVVAAGGGGIPVTRDGNGWLTGVEAVVDKDRAAALMAVDLGADLLLIPTGVERVAIGFGTPDEQWLDTLSPSTAAEYAAAGHFGEGSMGPKIDAILTFLRARPDAGGLITSPARIADALARRSGTWIENNVTDNPEEEIRR